MVAFRKMRIYQILLLVFALTLTNCFTDEYDLSKKLNTDMSVGGDALSIPLLKDSISLGSLITTNDSSMLKEDPLDGSYSINMKDSMAPQKVDSIPPVTFNITPITMLPIITNLTPVKFPNIGDITSTVKSLLPIPHLDLKSQNITGINVNFPIVKTFSSASSVKTLSKTRYQSKAETTTNQTIIIAGNQTFTQSFDLEYPSQLDKINTIITGNKVTLTLTKTLPTQGFTIITNEIKNFQIDFPGEYRLSNPSKGCSVSNSTTVRDTSSFIISNMELSQNPTETITASFTIDSLGLSKFPQAGLLHYIKDIPYKINYTCTGTVDPIQLSPDANVALNIGIQANATISNMYVDTKSFKVKVEPGLTAVTRGVGNIPGGISSVNSLIFDNAVLKLIIANPNISPFEFDKGNCVFKLPATLMYTSIIGDGGSSTLNTTSDGSTLLTIPGSEISGGKSITVGISSMNLNNTPVVNDSITVSDQLTYSIKDPSDPSDNDSLEVKPIANTDFNKLLNTSGSGLKFTGEISGLTVKDANMTTTETDLPITSQDKTLDVNQLVSKDVQRIYSVTLKDEANLNFTLNVTGVPNGISDILFRNYKIAFPAYLKLSPDQTDIYYNVNYSFDYLKNELTLIKIPLTNGKGILSMPLKLKNIDFSNVALGYKLLTNDGYFILNDHVTMNGEAYVGSTNLNTSQLSTTITVTPTIKIDPMSLSEIVAKIDPSIVPDISQNIKLDLPAMLKNDSNNLNIDNPVIELQFGNTMGIPIYIPLNLIPKKGGKILTAGIVSNTSASDSINIRSAVTLGQTTWSKYRLSAKPTGIVDDYTPIIISNLSNLLQTIPDEIEFKVTPQIIGDRVHVNLYTPKNELEIKYAVKVPLKFGEKFKFQFNDTINDLKKTMSSFSMPKQIYIIGKIDNKIPMDLALYLKPLDANGDSIKGITYTQEPIKYDSVPNTMHVVNFGLKEDTSKPEYAGALDKVDKFIVTVKASKDPITALLPLKKDQYFKLEVRIRIPDGISVNPNSTKK
jgi:hypothetical protein